MTARGPDEALMTSREVAGLFRVRPKTVVGWARDGKVPFTLTPSGRYRFQPAVIRALLDGSP